MPIKDYKRPLKVLGRRVVRKDMIPKVTGTAQYTGDIYLPGMLEAALLKSPYAHAKINSIDFSPALELPGVAAILTGKDTDIIKPVAIDDFYYTLASTPGEVFFAGQVVAVVAAETKQVAEEALKLIKVDYTPLPAVYDPKKALTAEAPLLHPEMKKMNPDVPGNTAFAFFGYKASRKGFNLVDGKKDRDATRADVEEGKKDADFIVSADYTAGCEAHYQLETNRAVANWVGDELTVWMSTQDPHLALGGGFVRMGIPTILDIPHNKVNIITLWVGGGFGGKNGIESILTAIWAAALSKKTGRPVRLTMEVDENNIIQHHNCGPFYYETSGGIKKDGTPTFLDTVITANAGGVQSGGLNAAYPAGEAALAVYNYQSVYNEAWPVYCNLNLPGPKRSYGDAEGMMWSEQFIDEMLEKIDADPVEWRKRWASRPGDPVTLRYAWAEFAGGNYRALIQKAADSFGWKDKWRGWRKPIAVNGPKRRGVGMALSMHISGAMMTQGLVKVNGDGTVEVLSAAIDLGQGIKTAICMAVAEVLGVTYDQVRPAVGSTQYTVPGGVYASQGTPNIIGAAVLAANDAKDQLINMAAGFLNTPADMLDIGEGKVFIKNDPAKFLPIGHLSSMTSFIIGRGWERWPYVNKDGFPLCEKSCAALFAEVEVDTDTGLISPVSMVSCNDCGNAINPSAIEGQIYQGIIQGWGYGIYGNLYYDTNHEGIIVNADAINYQVPTILECPDIVPLIHEDPADAPTCQLNAKGCGESTNVPVSPAIANAVYNACGVRLRHHPFTPDQVLRGLGKI